MRGIEEIQNEGREPAVEKPKKKRPRGRPRDPEVAPLKVQTWFRASPAEHDAYVREAKRMKIPLRTWIRMALNAAADAARAARKAA
jgi:hypothetical protein